MKKIRLSKKINMIRIMPVTLLLLVMLLTIGYSSYASKLNITSVTNMYWMFIDCGVQEVTVI